MSTSSVGGAWSLVWGWVGGVCVSCLVREDGVRLELSWGEGPRSKHDEGVAIAPRVPRWLVRRPYVTETRVVTYLEGHLGPEQAMARVDEILPRLAMT